MIFSLFFLICDICCLLIPYLSDKCVPLAPFSNHWIIACLSYIERTVTLCGLDVLKNSVSAIVIIKHVCFGPLFVKSGLNVARFHTIVR